MSYIVPLLFAALEISAKWPGPPNKRLLAAYAVIGSGPSLGCNHIVEMQNQGLARRRAHSEGQSVEDFRAQEIGRIDRYRNPYRRFFARRYLESECESLSLWQNYDRRVRGEAEVQVYRSVSIASNWGEAWRRMTASLQRFAQAAPKGPNHVNTLICEEVPTSVD